jgi:hypothetical protein
LVWKNWIGEIVTRKLSGQKPEEKVPSKEKLLPKFECIEKKRE